MEEMNQWVVVDGPLEGETLALALGDREQVKLRAPDGRTVIYSARATRQYEIPNQLLFVGHEAPLA